MISSQEHSKGQRALRSVVVAVLACALTLGCFLLLPLLQAITAATRSNDLLVTSEVVVAPTPDPIEAEEDPEEEEEEEEEPPELIEDTQPLDLSQLELALDPSMGAGWAQGVGAGFGLDKLGGREKNSRMLISEAELDQKPRPIFKAKPSVSPSLRRRIRGKVVVKVLLIVDETGRTKNPIVQKSDDPSFNQAAVEAARKWRFEPGKKQGKPVSFRMRLPFVFK